MPPRHVQGQLYLYIFHHPAVHFMHLLLVFYTSIFIVIVIPIHTDGDTFILCTQYLYCICDDTLRYRPVPANRVLIPTHHTEH